jgi:hypothetical protein
VRENGTALMVFAVVAVVGGFSAVAYGLSTTRERQRLEVLRKKQCRMTRASGHWGKCCILCGRPATDAQPVAVGGKQSSAHLATVHVCDEHRRLGAEPSRDRALAQREPEYYSLMSGVLGVVLGLVLGVFVLLARRRWRREEPG